MQAQKHRKMNRIEDNGDGLEDAERVGKRLSKKEDEGPQKRSRNWREVSCSLNERV